MDSMTLHPVRPEYKRHVWERFRRHHYLSDTMNVSARCWALLSDDQEMIGFTSVLAMPGFYTNAWREHRTVILPDYQGMGIGALVGDMLGEMHALDDKLLFSRTSHPRLARYRISSPLWKETVTSRKKSEAHFGDFVNDGRVSFAFQYVPKA